MFYVITKNLIQIKNYKCKNYLGVINMNCKDFRKNKFKVSILSQVFSFFEKLSIVLQQLDFGKSFFKMEIIFEIICDSTSAKLNNILLPVGKI